MKGLSVKRIERLTRSGKPGKYTDTGGVPGLMIVIENRASAHWVLRFQRGKRVRHMGLGSARAIGLAAARKLATAAREVLAAGQDPLEARRNAQAAAVPVAVHTFREAAERFFEAKSAGWSSAKHRATFLGTLRQWVYPVLGSRDVAAIGKSDVLAVLEQKTSSGETFWGAHAVTADRVRGRLESILDFAEARDWRPAGANPARWSGFLESLLPSSRSIAPIRHHSALPHFEVPALMAKLAEDPSVAARALQFLILTASRCGEALGATRAELDFKAVEWAIPAARMKARKAHTIPLAPEVIALLESLPVEEGNPFLFVSPQNPGAAISPMSLTRTLRSLGVKATIHGFRASFKTWAGERSGFGNVEVEMCLAHAVGNQVERAYQRSDLRDKRARIMAAWAAYCCTPPADETDVVVPMRRHVLA